MLKNNKTWQTKKLDVGTFEDDKVKLSVNSLKMSGLITSTDTLYSKIDSSIAIQTTLIDSVNNLSQNYEPIKWSISQIDTLISPITESVQLLGTSLTEVSKTALSTGELLKIPTYDFLNSPMSSALNVSVDAIKIGQERILSRIPDNKVVINLPNIGISNQVSQINTLNSIAVDYLQSSPILYPVSKPDERISDLSEKVQRLESKLLNLEEKKNNLFLTDATFNISTVLENLDDDISTCFKGAMTTLLEAKSEDMVGQVAESLTRVIERLPFCLSRKPVPLKVNKKSIYDAISSLKGISEGEIRFLVEQQFYFYSTLGLIRHRNKKIFNTFNSDYSRFKSLVVQAENFIYMLLTFSNEY